MPVPPTEQMILADTSAWVEFDRATGSAADSRLTQLIADEGPLAVTEMVVMEVVAGARTDQRELELRALLRRFHLLRFDSTSDPTTSMATSIATTPYGPIDARDQPGTHRPESPRERDRRTAPRAQAQGPTADPNREALECPPGS